jgi:hypothetical protein
MIDDVIIGWQIGSSKHRIIIEASLHLSDHRRIGHLARILCASNRPVEHRRKHADNVTHEPSGEIWMADCVRDVAKGPSTLPGRSETLQNFNHR